MAIVDFHAHWFSRTFFETLAGQSPLPGTAGERLSALAAKTGIELPPQDDAAHLARWIGELDRHGVEHLCAFASVPEEAGVVAQAAAASKGRLSAFALVNPKAEGAAGRLAGLLEAQRIRGVLLFPAMHHYRIDGAEARGLLEVLDRHAAIAYVHCGELVVKLRDLLGLPKVQESSFASPAFVAPAAEGFPRAKLVIPHFGAGMFRETLAAGRRCPNVFVDTSSSNSWAQAAGLSLRAVFEQALEAFGAGRILFGTDSTVFPAGWRADRLREQVAALEACGVPEPDRERILGGNARGLLGRR